MIGFLNEVIENSCHEATQGGYDRMIGLIMRLEIAGCNGITRGHFAESQVMSETDPKVWMARVQGYDPEWVAILADHTLFLTPSKNPDLPARLAAGEDPKKLLGDKAQTVPLRAIRQVEMNQLSRELCIDYRNGDNREAQAVIVFADNPQVVDAFAVIRERLGEGWTYDNPRQSVWKGIRSPFLSFFSTAWIPLILLLGGSVSGMVTLREWLMVLVTVLLVFLGLLGWVSLGPVWVLGIAALLVLAWLAWLTVCIVRRPAVARLRRDSQLPA
jgi:hypothetical protein